MSNPTKLIPEKHIEPNKKDIITERWINLHPFPTTIVQEFCLDLWVVLCIFFAFAFAFAKKELPCVWAAVEKGI